MRDWRGLREPLGGTLPHLTPYPCTAPYIYPGSTPVQTRRKRRNKKGRKTPVTTPIPLHNDATNADIPTHSIACVGSDESRVENEFTGGWLLQPHKPSRRSVIFGVDLFGK